MKKKSGKTGKKNANHKALISSFAIVILVALIGGIFTSGSVKSAWYDSIKPSITPPSFAFPIAWTILFILIAFSLYFAWIKSEKNEKKAIASAFGINLFLNILWSFLFFKMRNPKAAFIEIAALWISIIAMMSVSWKIDRKASWMLLPYLLWVSFAAVLNFLIAF